MAHAVKQTLRGGAGGQAGGQGAGAGRALLRLTATCRAALAPMQQPAGSTAASCRSAHSELLSTTGEEAHTRTLTRLPRRRREVGGEHTGSRHRKGQGGSSGAGAQAVVAQVVACRQAERQAGRQGQRGRHRRHAAQGAETASQEPVSQAAVAWQAAAVGSATRRRALPLSAPAHRARCARPERRRTGPSGRAAGARWCRSPGCARRQRPAGRWARGHTWEVGLACMQAGTHKPTGSGKQPGQGPTHAGCQAGRQQRGQHTLRAQAVVAPLSRPAASSPIRRSCCTFVGSAVPPSMKCAPFRGRNSRGMARPAAGSGALVGRARRRGEWGRRRAGEGSRAALGWVPGNRDCCSTSRQRQRRKTARPIPPTYVGRRQRGVAKRALLVIAASASCRAAGALHRMSMHCAPAAGQSWQRLTTAPPPAVAHYARRSQQPQQSRAACPAPALPPGRLLPCSAATEGSTRQTANPPASKPPTFNVMGVALCRFAVVRIVLGAGGRRGRHGERLLNKRVDRGKTRCCHLAQLSASAESPPPSKQRLQWLADFPS